MPIGQVTIDALGEQHPVDWLEGNPRLVLRLKASQRRCHIVLSAPLQQHASILEDLSCMADQLVAGTAHTMIAHLCRQAYPPDAVIHFVTEKNYYCTPSSLRLHPLEGMLRVTQANVEEVRAALIPGIADKLEYLSTEDILRNGPAFAWYQDGKPVGFAGTHASFMSERVGNVGMVFVQEPYRGQGAGKALVAAVAGTLLAANRVSVYGCFIENVASTSSAEKAGFLFSGYSCRVFVKER